MTQNFATKKMQDLSDEIIDDINKDLEILQDKYKTKINQLQEIIQTLQKQAEQITHTTKSAPEYAFLTAEINDIKNNISNAIQILQSL